mgnify:CR=1 FL=1
MVDHSYSTVPEVRAEIDQLFKGLALIYPLFCRGQTKEQTIATMRIWDHKLERFSYTQIMTALDKCPERFPSKERGPLIGDFMTLCRGLFPKATSTTHLRLEDLGRSNTSSPVAREALAELRKLVGLKTVS